MRTLVITDTETTGLDPAVDRCIEVAALLYDLERHIVVEAFSSLIRAESNAAEAINRIPPAALATAPSPENVWGYIGRMVERAAARGPACFVAQDAAKEGR